MRSHASQSLSYAYMLIVRALYIRPPSAATSRHKLIGFRLVPNRAHQHMTSVLYGVQQSYSHTVIDDSTSKLGIQLDIKNYRGHHRDRLKQPLVSLPNFAAPPLSVCRLPPCPTGFRACDGSWNSTIWRLSRSIHLGSVTQLTLSVVPSEDARRCPSFVISSG